MHDGPPSPRNEVLASKLSLFMSLTEVQVVIYRQALVRVMISLSSRVNWYIIPFRDVLHELASVGDLHPNSASLHSELSVANDSIFNRNEVFIDSLSDIIPDSNTFYDVPAVDESSWFSGIELPSISLGEANAQPQLSFAPSESVRPESPPRCEGHANATETLRKFGFTTDDQDSFLEPSNFCSKSASTSKADILPTSNESHNLQSNEMRYGYLPC